jgi:hypothetical protein
MDAKLNREWTRMDANKTLIFHHRDTKDTKSSH